MAADAPPSVEDVDNYYIGGRQSTHRRNCLERRRKTLYFVVDRLLYYNRIHYVIEHQLLQ